MTETNPRFFRHGPSLLARLVFFVMLSLVLMAVDARFKYLLEIRQAFSTVVYPLQKLANVPGTIYDSVSELLFSGHLADENIHLKQQHLVDRGQLQQLSALEAENAQLRKLLEATQRVESKAVMAEILHVPRDPFNRKVMLDKGSQSGVQPGQVVVDDIGVVGQITRDYPWASEVTLITDKDHSVPVQVVRNGLRSVISGTGKDAMLELRYLAVNTDIQEGDSLVTSGIDGVYPPGLPVAVVSKIERNPTYVFARVTCTPVAGVGHNRQLLILSTLAPVTEIPVEAFELKPEGRKREKGGIR
ncbi:rod shape-determining protein MreC [Nitrosospira sp. NRS527]|uniref:rod shape-determining protein MreC n=1 Tax=Nitrosospira sp. NRS527 TaxID=155925 RepID=UPI001AF9D5D7|nr:rod shape-determining protein MreC [Nitrosospira sp. NRS527]BCT66702.1 Cell shape-determining protein MreC [Nitrosospira sp. NRS527]